MPFAGYGWKWSMDARWRSARSSLRAARGAQPMAGDRTGGHALGPGYAGVRRSSEVCLSTHEDDGTGGGSDPCVRDRPGVEGVQRRAGQCREQAGALLMRRRLDPQEGEVIEFSSELSLHKLRSTQ